MNANEAIRWIESGDGNCGARTAEAARVLVAEVRRLRGETSGWRMLEEGEQILDGDQFLGAHGAWVDAHIGGPYHANQRQPHRRRVQMTTETGWRLLVPGEIIEEGDQYRMGSGPWIETENAGKRCHPFLTYRRRVVPA